MILDQNGWRTQNYFGTKYFHTLIFFKPNFAKFFDKIVLGFKKKFRLKNIWSENLGSKQILGQINV